MAFKFFNIGKANAEIESANAALSPALAKANIRTIPVAGSPVPADEAPLADKISALLAVSAPGVNAQNEAELITTNATLASELESLTAKHATVTATVGSLQQQLHAVTGRAEAAESSIKQMTAEASQNGVQLKAAMAEFARVNTQLNAINAELSRVCVEAGCLDLVDAEGKAIRADAPQATKIEAAEKLSVSDKLTAYKGAVNAAISRTGINVAQLPGGQPAAAGVAENHLMAKLNATTDPAEKTKLRREHMAAIKAGFKPFSNTQNAK